MGIQSNAASGASILFVPSLVTFWGTLVADGVKNCQINLLEGEECSWGQPRVLTSCPFQATCLHYTAMELARYVADLNRM